MLTIPPAKHKSRGRRKHQSQAPTPPPVALALQTASFNNSDGARVFLTFDRAIDVAHIHVSAFSVADGVNGVMWVGAGVISSAGANVQLVFTNSGPYSGAGQVLTVPAGNGIVAVDDGGTWEGATDLGLPYPPAPVTITSFTIVHNDAFPDGTYAEITFDHVPVSPSIGDSCGVDATADTSGGPEGLNGGLIAYDRNDGGNAIFNCTTVDQTDTFTDGGTVQFRNISGLDFGPGTSFALPVDVTITSGI
jgi:hypothetical protein